MATAALTAGAAHATVYQYALSGPITVGFTIDDLQPLGGFRGNTTISTYYAAANVVVNGTPISNEYATFAVAAFGGGFSLSPQSGNANAANSYNFDGPQLFSGPVDNPTLLTGDFNLTTGFGATLRTYSLRVGATAVPEPTSWAMMIAGFGLIGAAMRRRNTLFFIA